MDKRLFVGGLPYSFTDQALSELFARCGKVVSAQVITDKFTGQGKGFGFVEMSTEDEAKTAIEQLNDTELDGRKIVVNVARPREERNDRPNRGGFDRNRSSRGGRQNRW